MIKLRRMRWAELVACMGGGEAYIGFGVETGGKETAWKTRMEG